MWNCTWVWPLTCVTIKTCCNLDTPVYLCVFVLTDTRCPRVDLSSVRLTESSGWKSARVWVLIRVCSHASYLFFNFLWRLVCSSEKMTTGRTEAPSHGKVNRKWMKSSQGLSFSFIKNQFTVTTKTDIKSVSSDSRSQNTKETLLHHTGWIMWTEADVGSSDTEEESQLSFHSGFLQQKDSVCRLRCIEN